MKIAFHSGYLGFRGTEVALQDYARGCREILGHEPFFLLPWQEGVDSHPVAMAMARTAPVRFYRDGAEREGILQEEKADFFYAIKNGWNDGVISRRVPTGVHAIFRESEFHGDIYAYVSPWLARTMSHGRTPNVPHMVRLPEPAGDLRAELGIPADAPVVGRHGGDDSFDIPWVQQAVVRAARKNRNLHFVFLNTRQFSGVASLPNIHFLPPTGDAVRKRAFLETADIMLHARKRGETFGLACLEFASCGKEVLTFEGSPETAHLEILGDWAKRYRNPSELEEKLQEINRGHFCRQAIGCDPRFFLYRPQPVMQKFQSVFLS